MPSHLILLSIKEEKLNGCDRAAVWASSPDWLPDTPTRFQCFCLRGAGRQWYWSQTEDRSSNSKERVISVYRIVLQPSETHKVVSSTPAYIEGVLLNIDIQNLQTDLKLEGNRPQFLYQLPAVWLLACFGLEHHCCRVLLAPEIAPTW